MAKDPVHRYATWGEFALALSKAGQLVLPPGAIPDSERYVALKAVPMLSTLADSELWELARAGRWQRVEKGKQIEGEGEGHQLLLHRQGRGEGHQGAAPAQH